MTITEFVTVCFGLLGIMALILIESLSLAVQYVPVGDV